MCLNLVYKHSLFFLNLFDTIAMKSTDHVKIKASPNVPRGDWNFKKLVHAKNALYTIKKSKDDWTIFADITCEDNMSPKLTIDVRGKDIFDQIHGLVYGGGQSKMLKILAELEINYQTFQLRGFNELRKVKIMERLDAVNDPSLEMKEYTKLNATFPSELLNTNGGWNLQNEIMGILLSISVDMDDYAPLTDFQHWTNDTNQRLFEDKQFADFEIIAGDGSLFSCHKIFLSAQSNVFAAMLEDSFQEKEKGCVKLTEMSAESVECMLKFLYYGDVRQAVAECSIALELFIAADKYNIKKLEDTMKDLFIGKGLDWYNIDTALKLYEFLMHYLGEYKAELINKALTILSGNSDEIRYSSVFAEMSKDELMKEMFLQSVINFGGFLKKHERCRKN